MKLVLKHQKNISKRSRKFLKIREFHRLGRIESLYRSCAIFSRRLKL
ncbi:hypothetical protein LEP1GSC188_4570 [Leptospira weilii serovar Topaz str. LT2116]|uniref:Uncharacterized protein n=1 Tax=Leptospira weilii serovar Topaz str. LT2116 TaxID=1088540 RepID=M3FSM6_9LEPT|nr:hypothetical protein LEP1GSC188_4570 [Leptospira weilii serovar Topaz str. LT2116]